MTSRQRYQEDLAYIHDQGFGRFAATAAAGLLGQLFAGVYAALRPGGCFVFDILCAGKRGVAPTQRFTEGPDWFIAVDRVESRTRLTRRIIAFRQLDAHYRKTVEVHHVRKYDL